jgi:hypothetical protein
MSPFTLVAFRCNLSDVENPSTKQPTSLGEFLESIKGHRVDICLGMYVFDTQKGWQDIYLLCEYLRTRNLSFLRLPFEGTFFGHTAPEVEKALTKMGVTAVQYPKRNPWIDEP